MALYLSQMVPHAKDLAREALKRLKRSEREFDRGREEASYSLILGAASELERAAVCLRGYVDQMRQADESNL